MMAECCCGHPPRLIGALRHKFCSSSDYLNTHDHFRLFFVRSGFH